MSLLAAISQPSLCVAWTETFGQSLFCTTAVGASTKAPEGAYSIRTSDGVRNSKRAFPTPSLVRMEYAPSGAFVDAPTAVVQKRDWPKVSVQATHKDGWLIAASSDMTVRYRLQSGAFAAANLEVTWNDSAGTAYAWHPGDKDPLNLGGLPYSLDNVSQDNLPAGRSDVET